MKPRSDSLFHFTTSIETLKLILKNGFWVKYCVEDVSWDPYLNEKSLSFKLLSFCDIPMARLTNHVGTYGKYGLGMSKVWGRKMGLNPVTYLVKDSQLTRDVIKVSEMLPGFWDIYDDIEPLDDTTNEGLFRSFFRYLKPEIGKMVRDGQILRDISFIDENEWRYCLVNDNHFITSGYSLPLDHDQELLNRNKLLKEWNKPEHGTFLKFDPADINHLFVSEEREISSFISSMTSDMLISEQDKDLLLTKITSVEPIENDI